MFVPAYFDLLCLYFSKGALFSVIASAEVGATLLSGLIFPVVIPLVIKHGISPGVAFLLMACLCIIPLCFLL